MEHNFPLSKNSKHNILKEKPRKPIDNTKSWNGHRIQRPCNSTVTCLKNKWTNLPQKTIAKKVQKQESWESILSKVC